LCEPFNSGIEKLFDAASDLAELSKSIDMKKHMDVMANSFTEGKRKIRLWQRK